MYGSTDMKRLRTRTSPSPGVRNSFSTSAKSAGSGQPCGRATRWTSRVFTGRVPFLGVEDLVPLAERPGPYDAVQHERIPLGELLGTLTGGEDRHGTVFDGVGERSHHH